MRKKRPEIAPGITVDRDEGFGTPVIKGTFVEVTTVLQELASGTEFSTLEREYGVSHDGVLAALAYACEIVSEEPQARHGSLVEVSPGVTIDPEVRFGKPVLKGTRMDVATLLGRMAAGETAEALSEEYALRGAAVRDALLYAKSILVRETVSAL